MLDQMQSAAIADFRKAKAKGKQKKKQEKTVGS